MGGVCSVHDRYNSVFLSEIPKYSEIRKSFLERQGMLSGRKALRMFLDDAQVALRS
jgi:hypothetical protein